MSFLDDMKKRAQDALNAHINNVAQTKANETAAADKAKYDEARKSFEEASVQVEQIKTTNLNLADQLKNKLTDDITPAPLMPKEVKAPIQTSYLIIGVVVIVGILIMKGKIKL